MLVSPITTPVPWSIEKDLRSGVDVDTCFGVRHLGDNAWQHGNAQNQKRVGYAVVDHHLDERVAENYLAKRRYGGVGLRHCLNIGIEHTLDFGNSLNKFERYLVGLFLAYVLVFETLETQADLLTEF